MKILSWIGGVGLSLSVVFMMLAFSTASMSLDFSGEKPAVKTADRLEWAWDGGERARIGGPSTVHYQPGGSPRIVVRGPARLLDRVRFRDGELQLDQDLFGNFDTMGDRLDITITGVKLRDIGLSGSTRMDMGEIRQDDLKVSISGSGRFNASGSADNLSVRVSGSGTCDVGTLAVHTANVAISGSGRVDSASPQSADVSISGSGRLHFAAIPRDISSHISGSGRISDDSGQEIDRRSYWRRG